MTAQEAPGATARPEQDRNGWWGQSGANRSLRRWAFWVAKDTFALHQPTRTSHQDAIEGALLRAGREPVNVIMLEIGVVEKVQPAKLE